MKMTWNVFAVIVVATTLIASSAFCRVSGNPYVECISDDLHGSAVYKVEIYKVPDKPNSFQFYSETLGTLLPMTGEVSEDSISLEFQRPYMGGIEGEGFAGIFGVIDFNFQLSGWYNVQDHKLTCWTDED